jgi:hypothetical protein
VACNSVYFVILLLCELPVSVQNLVSASRNFGAQHRKRSANHTFRSGGSAKLVRHDWPPDLFSGDHGKGRCDLQGDVPWKLTQHLSTMRKDVVTNYVSNSVQGVESPYLLNHPALLDYVKLEL